MEDQAAGDATVRPEYGPPGLGALALEVLRWNWGSAYRIGWDAVRGWWAQRRDELGGDMTASDPDELRAAILADYELMPVPRDLPAVLP